MQSKSKSSERLHSRGIRISLLIRNLWQKRSNSATTSITSEAEEAKTRFSTVALPHLRLQNAGPQSPSTSATFPKTNYGKAQIRIMNNIITLIDHDIVIYLSSYHRLNALESHKKNTSLASCVWGVKKLKSVEEVMRKAGYIVLVRASER
jgi:hypothetical protein